MFQKSKNVKTQKEIKSTIDVVKDTTIKNIGGEVFKIALLEEKIDWISSKLSKYGPKSI